MLSRRISLTAVAIGVAIVQCVLPVPALAGINHGRAPQWRLEVNPIDAGASSIAPEFKIAIYENLVTEVTKAKQFSAVLRSGDSSANGVSNLLILKQRSCHMLQAARPSERLLLWPELRS